MITIGDKLTTSFSLPVFQKLAEQKTKALCSSPLASPSGNCSVAAARTLLDTENVAPSPELAYPVVRFDK